MNKDKAIKLVDALGDYIRAVVEYQIECSKAHDSSDTGWYPTSREADKAEALIRLLED